MNKLRDLYRLPEFENVEEQRKAELLNNILLLVGFGSTIVLFVIFSQVIFFAYIGVIFILIICKTFLQSGRLKAASYLVSAVFLLFFLNNICRFSGFEGYVVITSILIMLIFGVLLGRIQMLYGSMILTILLISRFFFFEKEKTTIQLESVTPFENLLFLIIILLSTATVLYFVLRDRDDALQLAREQLLQHQSDQIRITDQSNVLNLLHNVRTVIAHEMEISGIATKVVEAVHHSLNYPKVSLYLFNEDKNLLELKHQRGLNTIDHTLPLGEGLVSKSFTENRAFLVEDVKNDPVFFGDDDSVSEICVPLSYDKKVIGVLNLESADRVLTEDDLVLMMSLAEYVNVAITRIRLYEEQQQSEIQYRSLFNQTNDGVFLFDSDNNYIAINTRGAEMLGLSHEEIMQRKAADFVVPDEYEDGFEKINQLLAGKHLPVYERTFKRKDGSTFVAEINLSLIRNFSGTPVYFQSVVRDISGRKNLEQSLIVERNLLQSLIDAVPAGIYAKDIDSRFIVGNQKVLDGWGINSFGQLIGKTDADFLNEEYARSTKLEEEKVMQEGQPLLDKEEEFINVDGEPVITLTSKVPLIDKKDLIIGIVGTTMNVTRIKQAEAEMKRLNEELEERVIERTNELQEANQELEAFAYTVSHDLRAPLRAIDGYTSILSEEMTDVASDNIGVYIDHIHANIKRMSALINGLLDFSRLGRLEVSLQEVNISELVTDVWKDLAHERKGREDTINFSLSPLNNCICDPVLMRQVFTNLLSNAIKFTARKKFAEISVGVMENDGRKQYFVMDNGAGFDMKYEEKLFGVFERLHSPIDYEGTGVGLAIVKRIIQRHNGQIWADANLNEGATFFFSLPDQTITIEDVND